MSFFRDVNHPYPHLRVQRARVMVDVKHTFEQGNELVNVLKAR